jgi:hypothetical protein
MSTPAVAQIERRKIEAELLERLRRVLADDLGQERALDLLRRAVLEASRDAGAAFAATAPQGPNLAHFATILERWREGNALDIEDVRLSGDSLAFRVTRCAYAESYKAMGLSPAMADIASCCRDFGFVEGYSQHLRLERPETIAQGASQCLFRVRLSQK